MKISKKEHILSLIINKNSYSVNQKLALVLKYFTIRPNLHLAVELTLVNKCLLTAIENYLSSLKIDSTIKTVNSHHRRPIFFLKLNFENLYYLHKKVKFPGNLESIYKKRLHDPKLSILLQKLETGKFCLSNYSNRTVNRFFNTIKT